MSDLIDNRIVRCTTCLGQGTLLDQHNHLGLCQTCAGAGTAVWRGNAWWSWVHPVSATTIYERHLQRVVATMINGLLIVFTVLGALAGLPVLVEAFQNGTLLATMLSRNALLAAFWIGLLAATYLTSRLIRQWYLFPRIPEPGTTQPATDPWVNVLKHGDIATLVPEDTRRVIDQAWRYARSTKRMVVAPLHIVAIMVGRSSVASMLVRAGIDPEDFQRRLAVLNDRLPMGDEAPVFSHQTQLLLARAFERAADDHRDRITLPYLLAATSELEDPVRELLFDLGVDEDKLRHIVQWLIIQEDLRNRVRRYQARAAYKPKGAVDRGFTAAATPVLDRFSVDLTRRARDGHLPYVIGREDTIKKIFRIMESGRRSVIIVGEPGVGKTTILHALAERMATEDVPNLLQDKRLIMLSAGALIAGGGRLEERLGAVIQEIVRSGNIILVIEDIDQLVGISSSGGGLDAARILTDEVRQGGFLALATAESSAYRRVVEPAGLTSIFEKVEVQEMNTDDAIVAIESRVGGLEYKHRVFFTYDAISQSVRLSQRYLHEKTLPGKALEILEEAATMAQKSRGDKALVTAEDVATIVTEQSKINVTTVTADEQTKLLNLEEEIHRRVVGQDEAVKAVANALRRARAEIRDARRPIANLLFLGPTGVGKTELAKTVAQVYFGSDNSMIRLDMSEYQEIASINRMIGAPASGTGGILTEAVRQNPFSLVLLDELEKAHPDILNLFLQVMDDGRLTDALGRTIDFTNVIIIATSNAGTQLIQNRMRDGASLETIKNELINNELQHYFRPEFLNRFDSVVVFKPLSPLDIVKIVALMVDQIAAQLAGKGITLKATPEATAELAQLGFDPLFGARPLRRLVQERVDNALATFLLQGKLGRRDVAILEVGGVIRVEKAQALT